MQREIILVPFNRSMRTPGNVFLLEDNCLIFTFRQSIDRLLGLEHFTIIIGV